MIRMCRRSVRMLAPMFVAGVLSLPVVAADTAAVVPDDMNSIKTLDEIVITGRLGSLSSARQALIEAENRFYARYNELNKDNALDSVCRVAAPTGSRLTRRSCQPRIVDDLSRNEALKYAGVTEGNVMLVRPPDMKPEFMARTLQMLKEDPPLLRALLERARLQQYYEELRARKFAERNAVWD